MPETFPCVYVSPTLDRAALFDAPQLAATTERHKVAIEPPALPEAAVAALLAQPGVHGVVIEMWLGWPSRSQLSLAAAALRQSKRAWLHWPQEGVVECVDAERLASLRRLWLFVTSYKCTVEPFLKIQTVVGEFWRTVKTRIKVCRPVAYIRSTPQRRIIRALMDRVAPVPFAAVPRAGSKIRGTALYLRTDFWARISSGGSYGHTCYVAKELAADTEDFVGFMAHRFALLDDFGLKQIEMPLPGDESEAVIIRASPHYFRTIREHVKTLRPAYIYERLALGSFVGALLSQELQIPYIVEYNGSEISMRSSFDGGRYLYEAAYLLAEELAFRQATFVSVVSEEIKKTLLARGIPALKILVNPNGADLDAYAPPAAAEKTAIRNELGLPADARVVGFSGTFGGWHGVDVLAAAIPRICAANPEIYFLLIGDGNYKHQVDEVVASQGLGARVISAGRVPQTEGARLLKACDIYVSPHNSHMVDSRFFGSPTKLFEYMAMAGGIVASDLEQIGVVLTPALRVDDLRTGVAVTNQRAVLCVPGSEDEFVEAVTRLAAAPELCVALGANARQAVIDHYSWRQHIVHVWTFAERQRAGGTIWGASSRPGAWLRRGALTPILEAPPVETVAPPARTVALVDRRVETGDAYKDEVQRQWDNDPAGSHYVTEAEPHTLGWFVEVERYRYEDYAPWMRDIMEFDRHGGDEVLEIGGGMGTDLAQFAAAGAHVTDLDLSSGHLELARENFALRKLPGKFLLHDAESLPFEDNAFDLVYSNGVLHHTPNTRSVVDEIYRVLRPGGRAIIMFYAENSIHYWRNLVWTIGLSEQRLLQSSMGDIMSRVVEVSDNASARPLVKVYTHRRLRQLFAAFDDIEIIRRQMVHSEVPWLLSRVPVAALGPIMGWNLIVKARKPLGAATAIRAAAPGETAPASAHQ